MFPVRTLPLSAAILTMAPALDMLPGADATFQPVPLFDDGAMIRVPVNVFGETFYFLVDTGFTLSAIDTRFAQRLGKPVSTCVAENPLGTDNILPVYHSPEISIAGKPLGLDSIACLDLTMARKISGQSCDGILGMDFFATHVVSIDFDRGLFSILDQMPGSVTNTFVVVPLKHLHRHFTAEVVINQSQSLDLLVDTGDNSFLSLNLKAWQKVFSTNQVHAMKANVAGADNQVVQSLIGLVRQLTVQGLNYTNLHATLIRNAADPSHLGLGFFRRHRVVFDFPNRKLYLQPGRQFSRPDEEDMSGLHLLRENQLTVVYSVDENSPASNAGIKPGDVVISVNGQNASSLTLNDIRCLLQSNDGDHVTLRIKRESASLSFKFILKKVI
jgi:predicted aspartyl protease